MKKIRNPSRSEKIILDKLRMCVSDWLIRERTKEKIVLVNRYTNTKISRSLL